MLSIIVLNVIMMNVIMLYDVLPEASLKPCSQIQDKGGKGGTRLPLANLFEQEQNFIYCNLQFCLLRMTIL
jgi:hypothetical protein